MRHLAREITWKAMLALIFLAPTAQAMTIQQIEANYHDALVYASQHSGISRRVLAAVIFLESSGDPQVVSNAGAVGLMQLRPGSGGLMGYMHYSQKHIVPTRDYLLDWWNNIVVGASYLAYLEQHYFKHYPKTVKLALALAAYNYGVDNVLLALDKKNDPPLDTARLKPWMQAHLPHSVAVYVHKVLLLADILPAATAHSHASQTPTRSPSTATKQTQKAGASTPPAPATTGSVSKPHATSPGISTAMPTIPMSGLLWGLDLVVICLALWGLLFLHR
ncbi:lytic transglycosylase domain-containing protein [Acidihalobacter ferrooxydans]|uniref:Transglycosylase SLT domain-containing protein n=1 Tax=Acidihalobacter ferrooxydans TaxID=1765967 RepID=A0A1P8UJJ6_9GAMM|nr:transglycosylase SLT domain-containing protein [Acidihalobacter ferrooxydans]APZ44008.1 hypothetical protein BW247_13665 [Acidihalobacter ferrooxydans]